MREVTISPTEANGKLPVMFPCIRRWVGKSDPWFPHGRFRGGRFQPGGSGCRRVQPRWEGQWLVLPPLEEEESAILQMRGTVSSFRPEPFFALSGSEGVWHYGLAPGEAGWFCFCLPRMVGGQESRWKIMTRGFVPALEESTVFCSGERPQAGERLLVLAPHPDDAEIAAHGFYSAHAGQIWVLTMTGGEMGSRPARGEGRVERTRRAEIRVAESLEWPVKAGVLPDRVGNLMLPDGGLEGLLRGELERIWIDPALCRTLQHRFPQALLPGNLCADANEATDRLVGCLEEIRPEVIVCPHWLDTHPDHRATADLLARAARKASWHSRAIYAYTVHPVYSELEPFGAEDTAAAPPALLTDRCLEAFHLHHLSDTARSAKRAVLAAISDLRETEPEPSWWRDVWAKVAGSRHPASYLRRAVRQQEWFEVFRPDSFYQEAG